MADVFVCATAAAIFFFSLDLLVKCHLFVSFCFVYKGRNIRGKKFSLRTWVLAYMLNRG